MAFFTLVFLLSCLGKGKNNAFGKVCQSFKHGTNSQNISTDADKCRHQTTIVNCPNWPQLTWRTVKKTKTYEYGYLLIKNQARKAKALSRWHTPDLFYLQHRKEIMYHCFLIFSPSSTFLAVSWLTRAETKQQHSNCPNVYFSSDVKNQVKTSRKGK